MKQMMMIKQNSHGTVPQSHTESANSQRIANLQRWSSCTYENLRPVSLTSTRSNVMQGITKAVLVRFADLRVRDGMTSCTDDPGLRTFLMPRSSEIAPRTRVIVRVSRDRQKRTRALANQNATSHPHQSQHV